MTSGTGFPRRSRSWTSGVKWMLLPLVVAGLGAAAFHGRGAFEVKSVPVETASSLGESEFRLDPLIVEDLERGLRKQLARYVHRKIWEIDINEVEERIRANQWVKSARVWRVFPDRLNVQVTPRAPAFLLQLEAGRLVPVAVDGSLVQIGPGQVSKAASLPDVPLLSGKRFRDDRRARLEAVDFARALPDEGLLGRANISEIAWTEKDGFTVTLLSSRMRIVFGGDETSLKVARVSRILDYLEANRIDASVIDASFSKKVLVRPRKGP